MEHQRYIQLNQEHEGNVQFYLVHYYVLRVCESNITYKILNNCLLNKWSPNSLS